MRSKIKSYFNLILIVFLTGLVFVGQVHAKEQTESKTETAAQEDSNTTRIAISTSGPVKFNSHWLDNPHRLVVKFKSRNVIGKIDKEMVVNQGLIKKITAGYFSGARFKVLKTLTFELAQKVPYKIWQEGNTILLDIQAPLATSGFSIGNKIKQNFTETESSQVIKRLEAMDAVLKQTQGPQGTSEILDSEVTNKTLKDAALGQTGQAERGRAILTEPVKVRKNTLGIILWSVGLVSILGLAIPLWRKFVVVRTRNLTERIRELKLQLEEKDKFLEQVEVIRKTIEKTAIEKEKEYAQLKLELQQKNTLFAQEEAMRKEKEKALLELEKGYAQLRETSESLKGVLVKRGIAKELTLPQSKGELWILDKSPERRNSPRLTLTKDFHNSVILKVELPARSGHIKAFAENISSDGLCFETSKELDDKHPVNLKLFFYGGKVPNFKTQGCVVWKRTQDSKNYYGIAFEGLSEKVKSELQHYIETNLPPHQLQ